MRGFCSFCGSWLTWRNIDNPRSIDVLAGTLDERWLREGPELVVPLDQLFCCNMIEGVTDGIQQGERWTAKRGGEKWVAPVG